MPGNDIRGLMDRMIDPSQNQPIESARTVKTGQTFTKTAEKLHVLFANEGSKGAIRLKDGEFYVKGKFAASSEFWDEHGGTADQREIRHGKFHNAAQALSDAIDLEYGDLMVGDKKMSEYALGDFLQSDGSHRLPEEDLTALENKVLAGLEMAYQAAVDKGDSETINLLKDRGRILGAAGQHPEHSQDAQSSSGWHQRVAEYRILRDTVAEELRNTPAAAQLADQLGQDSSELKDALLAQADNILLESGTLHLGLTKRSVDKVLNYLQNNIAPPPGPQNADAPRFDAVASLHDKVAMKDNIVATTAELKSNFEKVENAVHTQMEKRDYLGTKPEEMLDSLAEMKELIETLESSAIQGALNDPQGVQDLANRINESASRLYKAHEPEDIGSYYDDDYYEPKNLRDRIREISSPSRHIQYLAAEFAKNMAAVSGGAGNASASVNSAVAPDATESLQQEKFFNIFNDDHPIANRLSEPQFIYQKQAGRINSTVSDAADAIQAYNSNLGVVKASFEAYLAEPSMDSLENLRGVLSDTLKLSDRLNLHLRLMSLKGFGAQDGKAGANERLLGTQTEKLRELSFAADRTREALLSADGPADNLQKEPNSQVSKSSDQSIPDSLPDLPENSGAANGGDIVPPDDMSDTQSEISDSAGNMSDMYGSTDDGTDLAGGLRTPDSGTVNRDRADSDDVEDVFGPPPPDTTATPGFGTPGFGTPGEAITPGGNGTFETVMSPEELALNGLGTGDLESKYRTVEEAADALYNEVEDRSDRLDELLEDEMAFAENPDLKGQLERGNKELSSLLGKLAVLRDKKEPEAWQEANALQNEFDTISERLRNDATTEVSQKLGLVDSTDMSDDLTSDDNSVIADLEVRDGSSTTAGGPQAASEPQGGNSTSNLDDHVAQQRQMHHRQSPA